LENDGKVTRWPGKSGNHLNIPAIDFAKGRVIHFLQRVPHLLLTDLVFSIYSGNHTTAEEELEESRRLVES
jgi:hypothetical protein